MVLRLDPRQPSVWRNPDSLQFGVDAPSVVLPAVSTADERMLAALAAGVSRPGLDLVATTAGATREDAARLLDAVRPALERDVAAVPAPSGHVVALVGDGEAVRIVGGMLRERGIRLTGTGPGGPGPDGASPDGFGDRPELAVIVADYVIAPEAHGWWLRRDIPHLPVVFGDRMVRVGPVVEPGDGPCLFCLEQHRIDADPAWPAIATQLWGRPSPLHSTLLDAETAARVGRLVLRRLENGPAGSAHSHDLDAAAGAVTVRHWEPHPRCACTSAELSSAAGLSSAAPGTGTAAPVDLATRRGAAAAAPA